MTIKVLHRWMPSYFPGLTIGPDPGKALAVASEGGLSSDRKRAEIDNLLRRELSIKRVGHQRKLARLHFLNLASPDRLGLAALQLEDHPFLAVLDQESAQNPSVRRCDRCRLIPLADHQAGVKDVRDELVEVVAAVRGQIGTDILPFAVNLVAQSTDPLEHRLPHDRIALRLSHLAPDSIGDAFTSRVSSIANCSPYGLQLGDDLRIAALLQLAKLSHVQHRRRESACVQSDRAKPSSTPRDG